MGRVDLGVAMKGQVLLQNSNSIFLDYISTSRITGSNGKNSTLILRNLCFPFNKPGYVLAMNLLFCLFANTAVFSYLVIVITLGVRYISL